MPKKKSIKPGVYTLEKSNDIHLAPLVKWPGGKDREIDNILKLMPQNYKTYIEPFAGGAALFFFLNHTLDSGKKNVISDIHKELTTFYKEIKKGNGQSIHEFISTQENSKEGYTNLRDNYDPKTDLEVASKFYFLRKTCFRGSLRYNKKGKFNAAFGNYKSINCQSILSEEYKTLFENTEIHNSGFEEIFEKYDDPNNFIFLDPPYDSPFSNYGYSEFSRDDHIKLAEKFKTTKSKCLMIIGKTDFIEELYKEYIDYDSCYEKKYSFKFYAKRVGDEINTRHLVIKNY